VEVTSEALARFFDVVLAHMNEVQRRVVAGAAAEMFGRGGKTAVATASGMSRNTVIKAEREVAAGIEPSSRLRAPGGGDKLLIDKQPGLLEALDELVHPDTRGNPMSLLRWTSKSSTKLAEDLVRQGFEVSSRTVLRLLHRLGHSLQANAKVTEGRQHTDRDAQFRYLHDLAASFIDDGQPVISVDTKKKELVGDFKNAGREWRPQGKPHRVRVHDFIDPTQGKAIPYGVYDLGLNKGWVTVGIDHDTATFAVNTIRRWWREMGSKTYPRATSLLVVADSGGSNGSRVRLWKWELQRLADATRLKIQVPHLPPGTSKGNKIEHRLFSFISQNWRGQPLLTHATIVKLIANTRTSAGLKVRCALDKRRYPRKVKVTDDQMATIRLTPDSFHGDWNYVIKPRRK